MSLARMENQERKKRAHIVLQDKINILKEIDAGKRYEDIVTEYGVSKSAISKIKKQKTKIMSYSEQKDYTQLTKVQIIRPSPHEQVEKSLYSWFCQQRSWGRPISGPILMEKALQINERFEGPTSFKASPGWLTNFKDRHGIEPPIKGDQLSSNTESWDSFPEKLRNIINEKNYELHNVYNADETGINWKNLPRTLATSKDKEAFGFAMDNERITALMCSNVTGSHKIPLLVISKHKRPKCLKNVNFPPVIYRVQKNSWMNQSVFVDWYKNDFIPSVIECQEKHGTKGKVLLLLDNAPPHPNVDILNSINKNFDILFLPANVAAVMQPMGQGVIDKCKTLYKKILLRSMIIGGKHQLEFLRTFTIEDCVDFLSDAWRAVSTHDLQKAWNQLIPSDPLAIDDADLFSEGNSGSCDVDEILPLAIQHDDLESWLREDKNDQGWEEQSIDEIVSLAQGREIESDPFSDDESDEDEVGDEIPDLLPPEILQSVDIFYKWSQRQENCTCEDLASIRKLSNLAKQKLYMTKKITI